MVRALAVVGVVLFGATLHRVAVADEPKGAPAAPADPTAELLAKLRQPITLPAGELKLADFAAAVEKATGVGVVVNEAAFRDGGEDPAEATVRPPRFKGATAAGVLRAALGGRNATYLVRRDHVEITTVGRAHREARQRPTGPDDTGAAPAGTPLVSAVVKERPVNEALADLAAEFDLTVVLAPQAGDQKAAFVSARLLNVPADKAIDLLAVQADLRVVRRGPAFLVTSKDHAEQLFNERMDREQRKAEVDNMRNPVGVLGQPPGRLNNLPGFCGAIGFAGNIGNVGFGGGRGAGTPPPGGLNGLAPGVGGGKFGFSGDYGN